MEAVEIKLNERDVRYLPAGALIIDSEEIDNYNSSDDEALAEHPRLRRIVLRIMPHWPLTCFYLHWSDGTDLTALDERVAARLAIREDFRDAVAGEALGMTCLNCSTPVRVVKAVTDMPIFTLKEMRMKHPTYRHHCPTCGTPWMAHVLEFIGDPAEQPRSAYGEEPVHAFAPGK
ncbi:hypothetical protein AB0I49_33655 [Streptomyces sp. NPDC050617]|uniref:hypothetical protein n=1 Tax=Streptomyces sp. NPDC050617 TaxID=3154628 RepID=UPI003425FFF8